MDYAKPLRQRGRKSALTCNVLFSLGGNTILRFPGNLCARMSGLGFKVTGAGPLLSCYAGCHLGHKETICGAEVFKNNTSAPKIARGAILRNARFSCGGSTIVRFPGDLCARIWGLGFSVMAGIGVSGLGLRAHGRCAGATLGVIWSTRKPSAAQRF